MLAQLSNLLLHVRDQVLVFFAGFLGLRAIVLALGFELTFGFFFVVVAATLVEIASAFGVVAHRRDRSHSGFAIGNGLT